VERPRGARPNVAEVSVAMIHLRKELRKLMIQAERRGMSYKELWHHFGPQGKGDGFVNRHDLVKGFRILGFDEMKSDDEEDDSMESGSVWMHLLGEIETNGRGNLSFSQFVKFVERLKRPERPTFKKETKKVEEEEEKGREKKKNKRENTSSSLQRVRVHARNEEMMGERKKKKKKKKKSSLLGDDTRESLKRSLLELQERVERNMFSSTFKSTSSKTIMPRITTPTKIKTNEEKEEEEPILPPPSNAHMYSNDEITRYYRIIIHKEIITEEEIKESSASSRMIAVAQSRVLRGLVKSKKRFSLIVLPDFFDTIDTMTEFANPLAKTIPECPILVLSQPRTNSKKVVLSNDVISNQFNMLLRHAESNSQIFYPCLALGFGNGGNVLMSHLISKRNDNRRLVRAAMVVNSFAYVDKPLRQNLTQLLKMPRIASHQERMMFLGALLFSDEFLRDETCRDKLRKFFRGRKIFSEKNNSELCHSISRAVRDALFHHQDLRPRLKDLRCPLLIVAASQDAFVLSKHSEEISSSIERVADTVPDCVTQQASTMMWFQGGHGLLQERTSAISSTVQRLAKEFLAYDYDENLVERKMMMAKGDVVRKSFSEEWEEVGEEDDDEEVDDEYKNDNNKKKNKIKGNEWRNEIVSQGSYQRTFSRDSQHVEDQADLRVREIESENRSRESERVSVLKKQKRERARQRNERARELEHHRKEIEETAQKLRDDQALKTEKEMEKEENRAMAYEERMTRSALRYEKSILEYTKNQKEAQWISEQLCSLRGEGIDRRKDLEKGMIVAEKRETRRQMKEKQRKYLAQNQFALADIELKGEKMGYGIDTEFLLQGKREEVKKKRTGDYDTKYVKLVLEGSRRLRSDFDLILNHREKALGAQRPVHEKMIRYMDSQTRMRKSLRIREKAIRQAREDLKRNQKVLNSLRNSKRGVDKNRSIVLNERNARLEKEMERLDSQIEECNQDLADLAAKLRINKEEVDTVDRGVQQVILVQKRLVRVLDAMKVELLRLYSEATHRRT
jgi:alpha-beta hydrolase superfamily lysophospholipase